MNKKEKLEKKYTEKDISNIFLFIIIPLVIWSAILSFIIADYNKWIGILATLITVFGSWFLLKRMKFII